MEFGEGDFLTGFCEDAKESRSHVVVWGQEMDMAGKLQSGAETNFGHVQGHPFED